MKKNEEMEVHVFANSDIDPEDTVCGVFYETRYDMVKHRAHHHYGNPITIIMIKILEVNKLCG